MRKRSRETPLCVSVFAVRAPFVSPCLLLSLLLAGGLCSTHLRGAAERVTASPLPTTGTPTAAAPSSAPAFPASRTPFPGGELFRAPEAPAAWKIKFQSANVSPKTTSNRFLQTAEIFLGKSEARECLILGNGEKQERWRLGEDRFRFEAQLGLAARDVSPPGGRIGSPVNSPDGNYRWSEMQELSWIAKESFWFRHDGPSGSVLIFLEDEEAFHPVSEPPALPPDAAQDSPSSAPGAPQQPGTAPSKTAAQTAQPAKSPVKETSEPPLGNGEPPLDPEPEPKGGKILPLDPAYANGLIPGVQLKPTVKAAAIDYKTRLPLLVQIGTETLVYTYETPTAFPEVPAAVKALIQKPAPPVVKPETSAVPLP
jgi:hypothetical protein